MTGLGPVAERLRLAVKLELAPKCPLNWGCCKSNAVFLEPIR